MSNPFQPAIDELEKDLVEIERKKNGIRNAINILCAKAGLPPRYPEGGGGGSEDQPSGVVSQIRPDTFYGKRMGTAARQYLEMRHVQNLGPAKPREIFDALKAGGFQFETKDDNVAMVSLRAMLRKNTVMFHKLPNGSYGLRIWYPNAKPAKPSEDDDDVKADVKEQKDDPAKKQAAADKKPAAA